ncbi:hypothetical protein F5Y08DRAFT_20053 [Xylaria arbuscula]|nr:hypothetical protein F5Y08DRAFT_20053 [Xylaria arbuscula]
MTRPRKRKRSASAAEGTTDNPPVHDDKRKKNGNVKSGGYPLTSRLVHPVLGQYFPCVQSLREYILTHLPSSSRLRRRKISAIGIVNRSPDCKLPDIERSLGALLDTTLVGHSHSTTDEGASRMEEWKTFSQRGDESYLTISNGVAGHVESQALIVEYVVRTLFNREKSAKWPDHILCNGFRRNGALGLRTVRPNHYVEALQQPPWPQVLALLGDSGERIMIDLLLDGAIFVSVGTGTNNICQMSGKPLSNIPMYRPVSTQDDSRPRIPQELVFVRSRMFYARPALNARGHIHFGLRHIHVLNRCSLQQLDTEEDNQLRTRKKQQNNVHTLKVMMYIFPRQFGLHNVFTSKVNTKETSQRLKDYTLREEEIFEKFGRLGDDGVQVKIPKRLRGLARELVQKFQTLHRRCSYAQLLHYYCPVCLIGVFLERC